MHLILIVLIIGIIYFTQERLYRKYWKKGLRTGLSFSREYMECGVGRTDPRHRERESSAPSRFSF